MTALIIEDEALIAQELAGKIKEVADDVEILGNIPSLKVARNWFMSKPMPDLFFMDIQLSDGVSFKLFEEFDLTNPVIFTTAYDEFAVRAFKVNSVDYLLKPVDSGELKLAIDKCRSIIESRNPYPDVIGRMLAQYRESGFTKPQPYKQKFIVRSNRQWVLVDTREIAAFEKDVLIYIHTFAGERRILDYESMDQIEQLLDPDIYFRANRQWIINIDAVARMRQMGNFKLIVSLKTPLKPEVDVSREKAPVFKRWLDR